MRGEGRKHRERSSTKLSTLETTQASIILVASDSEEAEEISEGENGSLPANAQEASLKQSRRAMAVARAKAALAGLEVEESNALEESELSEAKNASAEKSVISEEGDMDVESPASRGSRTAGDSDVSMVEEQGYSMGGFESDNSKGLQSLLQVQEDGDSVVQESPEMLGAPPLMDGDGEMGLLKLTASNLSISPPPSPLHHGGSSHLSSAGGSMAMDSPLKASLAIASPLKSSGMMLGEGGLACERTPPHSPLKSTSEQSPPHTPSQQGLSLTAPTMTQGSPTTAHLWKQYHNLGEFVKIMSPAKSPAGRHYSPLKHSQPAGSKRARSPASPSHGRTPQSDPRLGQSAIEMLRADALASSRASRSPAIAPQVSPLEEEMMGRESLLEGISEDKTRASWEGRSPLQALVDVDVIVKDEISSVKAPMSVTPASIGTRATARSPAPSPGLSPVMGHSVMELSPSVESHHRSFRNRSPGHSMPRSPPRSPARSRALSSPPRVNGGLHLSGPKPSPAPGALTGQATSHATNHSSKGVAQLESEISEQDRLLKGYQKENEKMAIKMKDLEFRLKEAQTLATRSFTESKSPGVSGRQVEAQRAWDDREYDDLVQAKKAWSAQESELKFEVDKLKGVKRDLESRLATAERRLGESDQEGLRLAREEADKVREVYKAEQRELHERLTWYQENQELITKNETSLKDQAKLIDMLKNKLVVAAESMVVTQKGDKGKALKVQRVADAKRIKELENQVRELEEVFEKRNPNSIASLVRATKPSQEKLREVEKLKIQLGKVESERDQLEEDHEKALRGLRQQFERTTSQNNRRVVQLEEQLKSYQGKGANGKVAVGRVKELEKQLADVRAYYKKKNEELTARIDAVSVMPLGGPVSMQEGETQAKAAGVAEGGVVAADGTALALKEEEVSSLKMEIEALQLAVVEARTKAHPSTQVGVQPMIQDQDRMLCEQRVRQSEMVVRLKDEELATVRCEMAKRESAYHEEVAKVRLEADRRHKSLLDDHDREVSRLGERHSAELRHVTAWGEKIQAQAQVQQPALGHGGTGIGGGHELQLGHMELQTKLEEMEVRYQARELEMQRMLSATKKARETEMATSNSQYEEMIKSKDKQIHAFRGELSAILEELKRVKEREARGY